jgi:hypothetical protein
MGVDWTEVNEILFEYTKISRKLFQKDYIEWDKNLKPIYKILISL